MGTRPAVHDCKGRGCISKVKGTGKSQMKLMVNDLGGKEREE